LSTSSLESAAAGASKCKAAVDGVVHCGGEQAWVLRDGSAVVTGEKVGGEVVSEIVGVTFVPIVVGVRQLEPWHKPVVLAALQPYLVFGQV
jgi:hypothetical protein